MLKSQYEQHAEEQSAKSNKQGTSHFIVRLDNMSTTDLTTRKLRLENLRPATHRLANDDEELIYRDHLLYLRQYSGLSGGRLDWSYPGIQTYFTRFSTIASRIVQALYYVKAKHIPGECPATS